MKTFNVPITYRSPLITALKNSRREEDKMKKDFKPALLQLGGLHIYLARHFGFCYGVENAIEIAFRTIDENPGRNIFLLSEMIHNPRVNADLQERGVRFMQDTYGRQLIPFTELTPDDIVIIPAFGTTLEIERQLRSIGIRIEKYNTTCPFVEKVWNRSAQMAKKEYTVIVHGKPGHEETRATFSHAAAGSPTVVVKDMQEAKKLAEYIKETLPADSFYTAFKGQFSEGFDIKTDLRRIGVVNQTTMLASDTQAIADYLRQTMIDAFGLKGAAVMGQGSVPDGKEDAMAADEHFADTRDTLCYATLDNQSAVMAMLETPADLAIVVGGYNSSNTSHLVELCEEKLPTYFISAEENILSPQEIVHYDIHQKREERTPNWLPGLSGASRPADPQLSGSHRPADPDPRAPVRILLTSGASCPDALVESIIRKLASFYGAEQMLNELVEKWSGTRSS